MTEPMLVQAVTLDFRTRGGQVLGTLQLAGSERAPIRWLSEEESLAYGEERCQLLEGRPYEFQVAGFPNGYRLRDTPLLNRSRLQPNRGQLVLGNHIGLLAIEVEDAEGQMAAAIRVEVCTVKISYREDYRVMLEEIADRCGDLLLDIRAPMQIRLQTDPQAPATLPQRFAFIRAWIGSGEFYTAVQRILAHPHRQLVTEQREADIRRTRKPDARTARQLASKYPRVPFPEEHPLAQTFRAQGVTAPTLPRQLTNTRHRETLDTKENRFIKHTLTVYNDFLRRLEQLLLANRPSPSEQRLVREATHLRQKIGSLLARPFFQDIPALDLMPLGSPVLQRKAGYRELLRAWIRFQLAACLVWEGGEDVFGAGKRDVPKLYEYWLFFRLLETVGRLVDWERPPEETLFERDEQGLHLRLRSGLAFKLIGKGKSSVVGGRLGVRLSYNRTFASRQDEGGGTWTRELRPDYTLSFWPLPLMEEEAERTGRIAHYHFDAKYRLDHLDNYQRDDLLKMHAYRDAIRQTEGAYVLYPGERTVLFQEQEDSLSGVGAFAMRPNGQGMGEVESFLRDVMAELAQRWGGHEQVEV
ncbi:MAG TPA: DUF2357 domain-containing protein [Bacilli bacterium]|nr:DUF2357 domain-containing protein [Bacilli bacterium]